MAIFRSALNARALTADGHKLIIRSDFPEKITDDEVKWLKDSGVTTVIDLRRENEVKEHPCRLQNEEGFFFHNIPLSCYMTPQNLTELEEVYLGMVDGQLQKALDAVESAPENVLIYCFVGKDRTGLVTALILRKWGVPDEFIINDYMASLDNLKDFLEIYAENHGNMDIDPLKPHADILLKAMDKYKDMHWLGMF